MSLFRVWRQVQVMATHSAQTYRQSRSVRTRSQTAFTLVSAFLLFSVPDCQIVRRYFETRTKAIRRITVYLRLDSRSVVSVHRKSEATHVEAKGACRRSSCIADSIRRVVPEPFQLRRTGYRPPSRASRSPLVGNSRDKYPSIYSEREPEQKSKSVAPTFLKRSHVVAFVASYLTQPMANLRCFPGDIDSGNFATYNLAILLIYHGPDRRANVRWRQ
jgi:hypothetical protein